MLADDTSLLIQLKARDERAFEQLIARHKTPIFNLLFRMTGVREDAEDLAQETFIMVYRKIDQYRGEAPLSTWIYRIAFNLCMNRRKYLRRRRDRDRQVLDEMTEHRALDSGTMSTSARIGRPDELVEGFQMERLIQEAISSLDEEQRAIVLLRDVQNLAYEDIAVITGLPAGTVKSRLHRGRMALKERLAQYLRST